MVYYEITSTNTEFQRFSLGKSRNFTLSNDGLADIYFSLDGINVKGKVFSGEVATFREFPCDENLDTFSLKSTDLTLRLWGW